MTPDICAEAADIAELVRERHATRDASGDELQWRDFAVLYRTHAQGEKLTEEFSQRNIPFTVTGIDVLESTPIRDLLAGLGVCVSSPVGIGLFRAAAVRPSMMTPKACDCS